MFYTAKTGEMRALVGVSCAASERRARGSSLLRISEKCAFVGLSCTACERIARGSPLFRASEKQAFACVHCTAGECRARSVFLRVRHLALAPLERSESNGEDTEAGARCCGRTEPPHSLNMPPYLLHSL